MKTGSRKVLLLSLVALSAGACTRRVQVESEPSRMESSASMQQPAMIDITGAYDFVVHVGDDQATGPMTISRAGDGYAVVMNSNMGEVTASNIRRNGNTLTMDANTPGGPGTIELTWQTRDRATGMVFLEEVFDITATRRP